MADARSKRVSKLSRRLEAREIAIDTVSADIASLRAKLPALGPGEAALLAQAEAEAARARESAGRVAKQLVATVAKRETPADFDISPSRPRVSPRVSPQEPLAPRGTPLLHSSPRTSTRSSEDRARWPGPLSPRSYAAMERVEVSRSLAYPAIFQHHTERHSPSKLHVHDSPRHGPIMLLTPRMHAQQCEPGTSFAPLVAVNSLAADMTPMKSSGRRQGQSSPAERSARETPSRARADGMCRLHLAHQETQRNRTPRPATSAGGGGVSGGSPLSASYVELMRLREAELESRDVQCARRKGMRDSLPSHAMLLPSREEARQEWLHLHRSGSGTAMAERAEPRATSPRRISSGMYNVGVR